MRKSEAISSAIKAFLIWAGIVGAFWIGVTLNAWGQGGDASRIGDRVGTVVIQGRSQRNPSVGDATSTTETLQPLRVSGASGCLDDLLRESITLMDLIRQSIQAPKIPGRVWPVEQAAMAKAGEIVELTRQCRSKAEALRELIKGAIR